VWVGGGHAKTVEPRDYAYQLPAGQRRTALLSGLRYRMEKGGLSAVEGLDGMKKPNTKSVSAFLKKIGIAGKATLLVSEGHQEAFYLSARNIPRAAVSERRNLNAGTVLQHSNVVFTKSALDALVQELKATTKDEKKSVKSGKSGKKESA
jgi:large subunit ribosomal protein L4